LQRRPFDSFSRLHVCRAMPLAGLAGTAPCRLRAASSGPCAGDREPGERPIVCDRGEVIASSTSALVSLWPINLAGAIGARSTI
jgi:hypothetical protein